MPSESINTVRGAGPISASGLERESTSANCEGPGKTKSVPARIRETNIGNSVVETRETPDPVPRIAHCVGANRVSYHFILFDVGWIIIRTSLAL